jgi:hypothetical protein
MRFPWLEAAVAAYLTALLLPLLAVAAGALRKLRRGFKERHENHAAHMDGFAAGADFDERDRKEAQRRRLRLER